LYAHFKILKARCSNKGVVLIREQGGILGMYRTLYQMCVVIDELESLRMPRKQQDRVAEVRYWYGVLSGYLRKDHSWRTNHYECQEALIKIAAISRIGYEEGRTKRVRRRFSDLGELSGKLDSLINLEIQSGGLLHRLGALLKSIMSVLF
jgi:hypothetical protein